QPRLGPLEQAPLRRDVCGEHRVLQQSRAARDRPFDEARLAPRAGTGAGTQAELAPPQPRRCRRRAADDAPPAHPSAWRPGRTMRMRPMATKSNAAMTAIPTNAETR